MRSKCKLDKSIEKEAPFVGGYSVVEAQLLLAAATVATKQAFVPGTIY